MSQLRGTALILFYPSTNCCCHQFEQAKKKSKKAGTAKKEKQKEEAPADAETDATASLVADEPAPDAAAAEDTTEDPSSPTQRPSLSQQSKLRSSSFRQGPLSPTLSPEGETAADIYRKQVARIEDLEKENKRLAKEAGDAERRYKQAEEALADLQEADREGSETSQIEKLVGRTHAHLDLGLSADQFP